MIYLNNSATSYPKPQQVIDAVTKSIKKPVIHSARTGLEREHDDKVYLTRKSLSIQYRRPPANCFYIRQHRSAEFGYQWLGFEWQTCCFHSD